MAVWGRQNGAGAGWDVLGQVFGSDGRRLALPFQVNETTFPEQVSPAVACGADGRFVVAWGSENERGGDEVLARSFAADGTALGPEIRVSSNARHGQGLPAVAIEDDGSFLVVWVSSSVGVFGRRFGPGGRPLGEELRIDAYAKPYSLAGRGPRIALRPGGRGFVVAWQGHDPATDHPSVFARFYDSARELPIEEEIDLEADAVPAEFPEVSSERSGQYLFSWLARPSQGELRVRRLRPPESRSTPRTADEVDCEAERLNLLLRSLTAPAAIEEGWGISLHPGAGATAAGLVYAGRPDGPRAASGTAWDPGRVRSFLLEPTGRLTLTPARAAGELEVRWQPPPSGETAPPPSCPVTAAPVDLSRLEWLARRLRPRGTHDAFTMAISRGEGVDTFQIALHPRDPGADQPPLVVDARVFCDRKGEPLELRLRRSTTCASPRGPRCSWALSWVDETGAEARPGAPPTLWFDDKRPTTLSVDLRASSPGENKECEIAVVCNGVSW